MARRFLLEFIGLPEHLCLIIARTAVYALINQGSFVEMDWTIMNLSVGIFPLTGANNGAKPPHLATR